MERPKENLENQFWNNQSIIKYFNNKIADFRIMTNLQKITERNSKNVLDLGCGAGRHTQMLCDLQFNIYACDINHDMLKATRNRASKYFSNRRLSRRIAYGDMLKLPFSNSFFDVIIATGVLHQAHSFFEYKKAIEELSRVLKSGGKVLLNIFTNKVIDPTFTFIEGEAYTIITKEKLFVTLLPKKIFYQLMELNGLQLEKEISEDIRKENTGFRAVLRANFVKK